MPDDERTLAPGDTRSGPGPDVPTNPRSRSESRVRDLLVSLAGTLTSDFDSVEFLHSLMETCVEVVGIDEAGLLLADESGGVRLAAASSDRAVALEALESQYDEGPCLDSLRTGEVVLNVTSEEAHRRWPRFWGAALALGIEAAHAVPLRMRGETIGSMGVFTLERSELATDDVAMAIAVANFAAVGLVHQRPADVPRLRADRTRTVGNGRVTIDEAASLLAELTDMNSRDTANGDVEPVTAAEQVRAQQRQAHLEAEIRRALDHDQVGVAFQPVFDLSTGSIVSAEALLRLTDTHGRSLPPLDVVTAAEASGLIVELGRRVLHSAAAQTAHWYRDHGALVPVAVNVSAVQLARSAFTADVFAALELAGVPPRALTLELTESVLLQSGSAGMDQLLVLRDRGIHLAIDDFGTGYASLLYLRDLPATTLKIDRSFVEGVPEDARAMAIVTGVIGLARSFGMDCIAEGIETDTQRDFFAAQGVLGQGFLLARPESGAVVSRLIAEQGLHSAVSKPDVLSAAEARDVAGARRDRAGAERDQAADERDDVSDRRDQVGDQRDVLADRRDRAGDRRDRAADLRDAVADERDRAGNRRDTAATRRDDDAERAETGDPPHAAAGAERLVAARRAAASDRERASRDRETGARERADARRDRETSMTDRGAGARERVQAGTDRTTSSSDREHGAGERARAEDDRDIAQADRGASARERDHQSVDSLTGAHTRGAGLAELEREIDRAARTGSSLVLAFIDVDGLKSVNDSAGHAAGDDVLRSVAHALQAQLRSYDLVIRYGGDEFLCAVPGLGLPGTAERLAEASVVLAASPLRASFTAGLVELEAGDTAEGLIARADAALALERRERSSRDL